MRILASAALVLACLQAQDPRVPIENEWVKVVKVNQKPHIKTRPHKHDMNRVMIYMQPGRQTIAYEGSKTVNLNWKAGEALWSPSSGMHVAEIVSNDSVTIAELELKKPGTKGPVKSGALDPVRLDPKHYKVEFENDQVRVVRVKIGAKETVPMHEHSLNRVVVYLSDQDFRITTPDGKATAAKHQAGDVSFSGPNKHKEENLSDKPFEIVVVELKG